MLLIYPPLTKACEAPAGVHRLAGTLRQGGRQVRVWDANLEAQLWLIEQPPVLDDTRSIRAYRNRERSLALIRNPNGYQGASEQYRSAVFDLDHLLAHRGQEVGARLGLADYRHSSLMPVRSADLVRAYQNPAEDLFYSFFEQHLDAQLADAEAVGISLSFLSQAVPVFALLGMIRRLRPTMKIYLGGGLITSWNQHPSWADPFSGFFDGWVAGPGEQELCRLLGVPYGKTPHDPLAYYAVPDTRYFSPGFILPYAASSGCWWNRCSFCPERAEGNRYRPISTSMVRAELGHLITAHRPAMVHFLDNAMSPQLLASLAQDPLGAPFYGFVRFDRQLEDPAFCRALRASGCRMVKLGIESGDGQVLQALRKGTASGQATRVLHALRDAGIAVYGYFLFGTPAEDRQAACTTKDFMVAHQDCLQFVNLAIFNMPIFGEDAARELTEPFYSGDLSLYTGFRHPLGWERGDVRRFLRQEVTREPAIAAMLRHDPPRFGSNHAAFMYP